MSVRERNLLGRTGQDCCEIHGTGRAYGQWRPKRVKACRLLLYHGAPRSSWPEDCCANRQVSVLRITWYPVCGRMGHRRRGLPYSTRHWSHRIYVLRTRVVHRPSPQAKLSIHHRRTNGNPRVITCNKAQLNCSKFFVSRSSGSPGPRVVECFDLQVVRAEDSGIVVLEADDGLGHRYREMSKVGNRGV